MCAVVAPALPLSGGGDSTSRIPPSTYPSSLARSDLVLFPIGPRAGHVAAATRIPGTERIPGAVAPARRAGALLVRRGRVVPTGRDWRCFLQRARPVFRFLVLAGRI